MRVAELQRLAGEAEVTITATNAGAVIDVGGVALNTASNVRRRVFRSLDAAVRLLAGAGVSTATINIERTYQ